MGRSFHVRSAGSASDRGEVLERDGDLVIVVADGAGGMRGGADASRTVVEVVRTMGKHPDLPSMLAKIDSALFTGAVGETTAIVAIVSGAGAIIGASVGDSEAWIVTPDSIDDLTDGQDRRRLGSGRAAPVSFARAALEGTLIVGTDGLFKYAPPNAIAAVVRNCANPAEALLQSTRTPDDITIVTVR